MRRCSFKKTRLPLSLAAGLLAAGLCVGCSGQGSDVAASAAGVGASACSDAPTTPVGSLANDSVTIDVSSNEGAAAPLIGFIHGIAAPSEPDYDFPAETSARIAALKPTLWKVSEWRHYLKAKSFGAATMFTSSDDYFNFQPIYYPWNDSGRASGIFDIWRNFDAYEVSLLQTSLNQAQAVDYWAILSEPQWDQYSATDQQRLLDTFRHGYHDFKDVHSEQKVVAPTTVDYTTTDMQRVLDFAVANNLRFDAIDWHELGTRPEDVVKHVQDLRALLAARPSLGQPPAIIDEYASAEQHHLPGFAVGWFYYLEKSAVLLASRACWDMSDSVNGIWSNCWNGLNGLFMKDNVTPQPLYWVFNRYAQMLGRKLAATSSAPSDVVALARSTSTQPSVGGEIKVLVGRFASDIAKPAAAMKNITVQLQGLPAATRSLTVDIERIPYCGPDVALVQAQALLAPESVDHYTTTVANGKATAVLPAFRDRDAYYLSFK